MREFILNISDLSVLAGGFSLRLTSSDSFERSLSILRGEDIDELGSGVSQLSKIGSLASSGERLASPNDQSILIAEMTRVENSIGRINIEISNKAASLLEMDVAADTALADIVSNEDPEEDDWLINERVGRTRR